MAIPRVFFEPALRLCLMMIISCIPGLLFQALAASTTLHLHSTAIVIPVVSYILLVLHYDVFSEYYFPLLVDLFFVITEITLTFYQSIVSLKHFSTHREDLPYLSLVVFAWTSTIVLTIVLALKVADALNGGRPSLTSKYVFVTGEKISPAKTPVVGPDDASISTAYMQKILDKKFFVFGFFIYVTVALAWNTLVYGPLYERMLIPIRESRSDMLPADLDPQTLSSVWNHIIVARPHFEANANPDFSSALQVVELGDNGSKDKSCTLFLEKTPRMTKVLPGNMTAILDFLSFRCPSNYVSRQPSSHIPPPETLVTVNFSTLNSAVIPSANMVQVLIGSIQNADDDIRRTETPVLLKPGMRLVGSVKQHIMQKFRNPAWSTFGVFAHVETFLVSEITQVGPDPLASNTSIAPDVGTIKITSLVIDFSDWKIVHEYRDRSVLKGFSTVGGLWSFLSGIFVFLFGCSMTNTIFNQKPLSVSGIYQKLRKEKTKEFYREKYPKMAEELEQAKLWEGFTAFLVDHFVDVDLLQSDGRNPEPEVIEEEKYVDLEQAIELESVVDREG